MLFNDLILFLHMHFWKPVAVESTGIATDHAKMIDFRFILFKNEAAPIFNALPVPDQVALLISCVSTSNCFVVKDIPVQVLRSLCLSFLFCCLSAIQNIIYHYTSTTFFTSKLLNKIIIDQFFKPPWWIPLIWLKVTGLRRLLSAKNWSMVLRKLHVNCLLKALK